MKAVQINEFGGKDVAKLNAEALTPTTSENHALVEVYAASCNPIDWKVREGIFKPGNTLFPITLGGDFAGVIMEDAGEFKTGDEVYGHASVLSGGSGTYAEIVSAPIIGIYKKPTNVNFEQAAALPLVGASAVIAIYEHINLQSGQKILIHGGSGGIGSTAIQIAKHIGAYVVTTAKAEDSDTLLEIGADEVIDYQTQKFYEHVSELDAVFDTVGGEPHDKSYGVLKPEGIIVSMISAPNEELATKYSVKAIRQETSVTTERLSKLNELVEEGAIDIQIDKTFSLDSGAAALEYLKTQHTKGKIVINIKE